MINSLKKSSQKTPYSSPNKESYGCILWIQPLFYILPQSLQWCMQYHVILDRITMSPFCICQCQVICAHWIYLVNPIPIMDSDSDRIYSTSIDRCISTDIDNSFCRCTKTWIIWQFKLAHWETPTKGMSDRLCRSHPGVRAWQHTMDMLWEKFHWILPLYMKPINFQSKASVVCSVTAALFIDFCLKKLNVFSQHIGTKTNEYLDSTEKLQGIETWIYFLH